MPGIYTKRRRYLSFQGTLLQKYSINSYLFHLKTDRQIRRHLFLFFRKFSLFFHGENRACSFTDLSKHPIFLKEIKRFIQPLLRLALFLFIFPKNKRRMMTENTKNIFLTLPISQRNLTEKITFP